MAQDTLLHGVSNTTRQPSSQSPLGEHQVSHRTNKQFINTQLILQQPCQQLHVLAATSSHQKM